MSWWQYVQQQMEISRDAHKYCHQCRKLTTPGNEMVPVESSWNPQEEAYAMYVCSDCDEKYAINDLDWQP
jgi:RNase P subunit RPR2